MFQLGDFVVVKSQSGVNGKVIGINHIGVEGNEDQYLVFVGEKGTGDAIWLKESKLTKK